MATKELTREDAHKLFRRVHQELERFIVGGLTAEVISRAVKLKVYQAQDLLREAHIAFLKEGDADGAKD